MRVKVIRADERSRRTGALYPLATLERDAPKLGPCDVIDGAGKVVGRADGFAVCDGWLVANLSLPAEYADDVRIGRLHVRLVELIAVVTRSPTDEFPDAVRFDFLVRFDTLLLLPAGESGWDE